MTTTTTTIPTVPKWVAILQDAEALAKEGKVAESDALVRIACAYVDNTRGF